MGTERAPELIVGSLLVDEVGCPHVAAMGQRSPARSTEVASKRGAPCVRAVRAATEHPRVMAYRRLMAAVVVVNLVVLIEQVRTGAWQLADGSALSALSTLTLVNLTVAVLVRNQAFLNALYGLAGRGSPSWPLWVRWSISKVHHFGGLHVGCAVAGTAWLGAFTGVAM